jgi:hypothetical protein
MLQTKFLKKTTTTTEARSFSFWLETQRQRRERAWKGRKKGGTRCTSAVLQWTCNEKLIDVQNERESKREGEKQKQD